MGFASAIFSRGRRQSAPADFVRRQGAGRVGPGEAGESDEILDHCINVGGSITGEHGVGMEKMEMMGHQFAPDALDMIGRFKKLNSPGCRLNPGRCCRRARLYGDPSAGGGI